MHGHHQKVFQVGPGKNLIPKRSKPQNTCLSETMVKPEWGRAGLHSIPLPSPANCRCSCRPWCTTGHGHYSAKMHCHSSCPHGQCNVRATCENWVSKFKQGPVVYWAKAWYWKSSLLAWVRDYLSLSIFWKSYLLAFGRFRRTDTFRVNNQNTENATYK